MNYIKKQLSPLADFGIGVWANFADMVLGNAIYEYDAPSLGVHIVLYEEGVRYHCHSKNLAFTYKELNSVDDFLPLVEVARLNNSQLLDELVSFTLKGKDFNESINVPFKVYVCLAPLLSYLAKNNTAPENKSNGQSD